MRITVIGAGNGGSAVAADLALKGHDVILLKTSKSLHSKHFEEVLNNGYKIELVRGEKSSTAQLKLATYDYEKALKDSEVVILFIQTNYHEQVIKKMSKFMKDQIVLVEPGYLATLYFMKHCDCDELTIAEAESSPIDCRILEPGKVISRFENEKNPIGIYTKGDEDKAFEKLQKLGYNFVKTKSVVESALHNPNLIVHTIGAFMSIPRIEYTDGNYWMYKEVFTPTVWNIVKGLDKEKMDVMEKLGYRRIPYVEACKLRNSTKDNRDATEVFFDYAQNHSTPGPHVSDSRYLTEDVPEGLVLLESIGKHLGIDTTVCTSLINLSSTALCIDFRKEGRTIDKLGVENFKKIIESK